MGHEGVGVGHVGVGWHVSGRGGVGCEKFH